MVAVGALDGGCNRAEGIGLGASVAEVLLLLFFLGISAGTVVGGMSGLEVALLEGLGDSSESNVQKGESSRDSDGIEDGTTEGVSVGAAEGLSEGAGVGFADDIALGATEPGATKDGCWDNDG